MEYKGEKLERMRYLTKELPIANFVLFIIFAYIIYGNTSHSNIIILLIINVISFILTIINVIKKSKNLYIGLSVLPFVISLIFLFLLFTGLIVYIQILFFDEVPYAPN